MNVGDLKKLKHAIEKLDSTVKNLEYSEKNTLPDARKALHRDLIIPMMDEEKKEMTSMIDQALILAEKEGLGESDELPIPESEKAELESMFMATKMIHVLANMLDGIMETDLKK